MRRYIPLFFIAISILAILVAVNIYWIHQTNDDIINKSQVRITVYTTLPVEIVSPIASEYEKLNKVKVDFVILSNQELLDKINNKDNPLIGQADVLLNIKRKSKALA